ncbi:MAG: glycosyltransferase [Actinomycetota bacterium]|nr:glycosyltransferase [Actinomycetota bacterium]
MKPVLLRHVDLAEGLPALEAPDGTASRWYLWWGPRPLGVVHLEPWQTPVTSARLARLVAEAITPAVGDLLHPGTIFAAALPYDGEARDRRPLPLPALLARDVLDEDVLARLDAVVRQPPAQPVGCRTAAVVVCTRDRPQQLRTCLRSLRSLTRPPDELVVVDNGSATDATRRAAEEVGATYVREPRPGLSRARDAGIAATTSDVVAFTDDDVQVHPEWLGRLLAGFRTPDVLAVTGLVLPASLDSAAEQAFEDVVGGFGQGFRDREFGHEWLLRQRRKTPHVWKLGAGASVAFRRGAFDRVGGFDPRLGAGAAGCSEDSEMWYRVLAGGWRCRYEASAVVFHAHRDTDEKLRAQSSAYLRGHVAALAVQWSATRQLGEPRRAFLTLPRYFAGRALDGLVWRRKSPTLAAELAGYAAGVVRAPALLRPQRLPLPPLPPPGEGPVTKTDLGVFLAANPFPHRHTLGSFYGEKMRAIHQISPERGVRRVVEVGGGQSGLAAALYPSAHVLTVDLDPAFGARHDLYGGDLRHFVCGDATRLPVPDGAADVVTLFDVVEHIPDDAAAIREALRILRPGGSLLLTTPSELWRFPYYRVYRRLTPTDRDVMDDWGHVRRGYRVADLDRLVGQAHDALSTFITPITVIAHDLAFSRLPAPVKRAVGLALGPVVLTAAALHRPGGAGTEIAMRWTVR